jgi:hypothetical protein
MSQPTKEQIRHWSQERIKQSAPPPDPKQIRRELGWDLIEAERNQQAGRR